MSSSIITDPKRKTTYDVYLSFSAKDPSTFIFKLHKALSTYVPGALIFFDHTKLQTTDQETTPSESSLKVIEDCKIAVVILSKNYTNSPSCIQELEKITEYCRTPAGLIVLTVLYPIHPRLHRHAFGKVFHDFMDTISIKEISPWEDKIMTWVEAITKSSQYPTDFVPTNQ